MVLADLELGRHCFSLVLGLSDVTLGNDAEHVLAFLSRPRARLGVIAPVSNDVVGTKVITRRLPVS